ncbi:N-acetylmuramoyl-L-alanine amidase [Rhizobiales bacterium GAS191]|jgi:N-acetylmuramoyl-L-alanine amidase|nr:N-acetylmuramoyl-L-alanine amidase [Rhizobiales bacterium GAS113]SEE56817.1 N-acetylmuramoyl-L-alanine amidase [Rhizobiales bacterium GAS191]
MSPQSKSSQFQSAQFKRLCIASPNHGERRAGVDMLVLHYTGMPDAPGALARLTDPRSEVSSHYLVDAEGVIYELVCESRRAWHAGQSSWKGETDLNSRSIGIEIDHPGHEGGNPPFAPAQLDAVITLCGEILSRWPILPCRVLGHSDIAPRRKLDPGERFPWDRLFHAGIGHWVEPAPLAEGPSLGPGDDGAEVEELQRLLAGYGYPLEVTGCFGEQTRGVVEAFQRHFRSARVDGRADPSTLSTLRELTRAL